MFAVFLISVGVLLLANNFNYLPWGIWQDLIFYWPVLIVFVGLKSIFGKSNLGKVIANVIMLIILLLIISKVTGFSLPFKNPVPLPKNRLIAPEYFYSKNVNRLNIN